MVQTIFSFMINDLTIPLHFLNHSTKFHIPQFHVMSYLEGEGMMFSKPNHSPKPELLGFEQGFKGGLHG